MNRVNSCSGSALLWWQLHKHCRGYYYYYCCCVQVDSPVCKCIAPFEKFFEALVARLLPSCKYRRRVIRSSIWFHHYHHWTGVRCHLTPACGCIHIDMSASPEYLYRVSRNTSLRVFQWRPFTLIQVLQYGLPVNFTRRSSFCAGRVFIKFVRINTNFVLIWFIHAVMHIWGQKLCHHWIVH